MSEQLISKLARMTLDDECAACGLNGTVPNPECEDHEPFELDDEDVRQTFRSLVCDARRIQEQAKTYNVIGLHENGETFAELAEADDPADAIRQVADAKAYADAEILGAIETTKMFYPACEDSGKSAHVSDLMTQPEDDK